MSRVPQLSAFADRDPYNPVLLCDLVDELLMAGAVDEALACLNKTPVVVREFPAVRFREARCALMQGDATAAIALLTPLAANVKDAPIGVVHDLAYAQFVAGLPEKALETLAEVRAAEDDNAAISLLRARILHRQQQLGEALDALAHIKSGARLPEVQGVRSLLWLDLGDCERAAAEADAALKSDPDQHEAGLVSGTLALRTQRLQESALAFERVLAHYGDSGRAWLGLGQNLMLRGDIPAARSLLERATNAMPGHIGTWHTLAWCQLLGGDLVGAKRSFDKAFALDRTFGETHGGFALVHALRSERKEAEDSIKRAMRLDPQGHCARYAESVLLLDEGRKDEACALIDGILTHASGANAIPADFIFRLRDLVRPRS